MLSQEAVTAVEDKGLQAVVVSGVAYHHAALSPADRSCVERLFIAGDIAVNPQLLKTQTLQVFITLIRTNART